MSPVVKASTPDIDKGYEYGTATVYHDGVYYRFFCSYGLNSDPYFEYPNKDKLKAGFDYIRMRTSKDGSTWSTSSVVLVPSSNVDSCACDPAIVQGDDGFWYLYYTGFQKEYSTITFLARSQNIEGPYKQRFMGEGKDWVEYPENPEPLFKTLEPVINPDESLAYGAGQVSVVKTPDGKYHFWFTDVYDGLKAEVSQNAKLWKYVHVVTDAPYGDFQDLPRTTISLDGETMLPMNDFGDVKWNNDEGVFEMWRTSVHYTLAYFVPNNEIYVKRFISKDGNEWTSTGDSMGPFHFASNVGMSGDENGWIIGGSTLVTFAANSDSTLFNEEPSKFLVGCKKDCDKDESWKYLIRFPASDEDRKEYEGFQGPYDEPYPTMFEMWWNVNHKLSEAVPGLPWSTYQFVAGEYEASSVSIPNSGYDCIAFDGDDCGMKMQYYQFSQDKPDYEAIRYIVGDFDGDAFSDIGRVDCSKDKDELGCRWYIRSSKTGKIKVPKIDKGWLWKGMKREHVIVLGDFDGDGKTDRAIVDTTLGLWYIFSSSSLGEDPLKRYLIGAKDDSLEVFGVSIPGMEKITHPLTGDYDGDGISDIGAVTCKELTGESDEDTYCQWRFLSSMTGKVEFVTIPVEEGEPEEGVWKGMSADHVILEGDYDGDGKTDPAIWEPSGGLWMMISSRTGAPLIEPEFISYDANGNAEKVKDSQYIFGYQWGGVTYQPVVGDFNGDGIADRTLVLLDNANEFQWYSDPKFHSPSYLGKVLENQFMKFGKYQLLVGDFDGDVISDCAVVDVVNAKVYFYTSLFKGEPGEKEIYRIKYSEQKEKNTGNIVHKPELVDVSPFATLKITQTAPVKTPKLSTKGMTLTVSNIDLGTDIGVFNMIGQRIVDRRTESSETNIALPSKGKYIVRAGARSSVIEIK
jgi:hypothetical protein